MSVAPASRRLELPLNWSGQQASAVLELLQTLQDQVWLLYHHDIQDFLRREQRPDRGTIDHDDVLTLAINVLRDSADCLRMPSGLQLPPEAADLHRLAADWLEHYRNRHCPIP